MPGFPKLRPPANRSTTPSRRTRSANEGRLIGAARRIQTEQAFGIHSEADPVIHEVRFTCVCFE